MNQYIATGRTGYWTHDSWHEVTANAALETLKNNIPDAEVVAFILENVHGEMFQEIYAPTAILNMVPVWSECPEGVVQYLDWMCISDNAIGPVKNVIHFFTGPFLFSYINILTLIR